MKYIFDFDDVLFNNTKEFRIYMYACLEEAGVARSDAEAYYETVRTKEFSLIDFISNLLSQSVSEQKGGTTTEEIYGKIMSKCKDFINIELIEKVKTFGKDNCYIITNGERKFQEDKMARSGITPLFKEIHIVPGSKKEFIYTICNDNKDEEVFYFEDKIRFIEDVDLTKCHNLKVVHCKIT